MQEEISLYRGYRSERPFRETAREALGHLVADSEFDFCEAAYESSMDGAMQAAIMRRAAMEKSPHEPLTKSLLGNGEERVPTLQYHLANGELAYALVVDAELNTMVGLERAEWQSRYNKALSLSPAQVIARAIEATKNAVEGTFRADALNAVNAAYYSTPEVAFAPESRIANVYAANRPLNVALGMLMADCVSPARSNLRIKELSCGGYPQQWRHRMLGLASEGIQRAHITLSDFAEVPVSAAPRISGVTFDAEKYSLFDDMPPLSWLKQYDAMLITYGFDSVWQPEDTHFVRNGDTWYQTLYRVKVADWHPRYDDLLLALRNGKALPDAHPSDFDGIVVERILRKVDPWQHRYNFHLVGHDQQRFNFPGGLIKRVVNAFQSQLDQRGVFISCDSGYFGQELPYCRDAGLSGIGARYHMDDYTIAKEVLEAEYGLRVRLLTLPELAERYLPSGWQAYAMPEEVEGLADNRTNGVMVVTAPRVERWRG